MSHQAGTSRNNAHMDGVVNLPPELKRHFLAALQVVRPGSVEEELTENVCIALLKDRQNPKTRNINSRPGTAESVPAAGVSENEWKLMQRAKALEDELRLALCAAEDIRALKHKANLLMEDVRKGKEEAQALSNRNKKFLKDQDMLRDHCEKLMKVVRQMSIEKIKQEERSHEDRRLIFKLTQDNVNKDGKIVAKRKAIKSLQEVVQLMNKQLELMDQKYVDLRMRFDAAKHAQNTTLDKAVKQADELRKKFNIMTHGRGRLDDVPLPTSPSIMAPNSTTVLQTGEQWMDASQGFFPGPGGTGKGQGPGALSGNQIRDRTNTPDPLGPRARPATTGGIGRSKRPGTPGSPASAGAGKRGERQGNDTTVGSVPDEHEIDKIIEKIYIKQKRNGGKDNTVWTPKKLASLVMDSSGRVGCFIPDLTGNQNSVSNSASGKLPDVGKAKAVEQGYSKLPSR